VAIILLYLLKEKEILVMNDNNAPRRSSVIN
jgi:hypothetical protein